jgi:hypothetical protein
MLPVSRLYIDDDRMINEHGAAYGMRTGGGKPRYLEKTCLSATSSTKNPE